VTKDNFASYSTQLQQFCSITSVMTMFYSSNLTINEIFTELKCMLHTAVMTKKQPKFVLTLIKQKKLKCID